jgi:aldose 1-epimerase
MRRLLGAAACVLAAACTAGDGEPAVTVARETFGRMPDGTVIEALTLRNAHGIAVKAITYGGIIVSLETPDRDGGLADIVLGFDSLPPYLQDSPYFGAIVGRYANRIARGRFTLDGTTYELATNNGPNHLHGGVEGFDKVVWEAAPFVRPDSAGVILRYTSADGEEGYPGTLRTAVTYTLTADDALLIDYHATADAPTPVNLAQHSYFNLAGDRGDDILGHVLTLRASRYTPVDATLIPTGELAPVAGTPFDFTTPHAIGARIATDHEQLRFGGGYDHNFVLDRGGDALAHAASVYEPASGRTVDIHTTEPGIQFYSGNFLDGSMTGKRGRVYGHRTGFCLETQHFPDSPNQPAFPGTVLRPGEEYRSRTVWVFGVRGEP